MNTSETTNSSASGAEHPGGTEQFVVVGVDGSDASREALRTAARFAQLLGASLRAVTAWSQPVAVSAYAVSLMPDLADAAGDSAREAVHAVFGEDLPASLNIVVRQGNAAHVLITESEGAEMLVVGSRGHGGFAGLLLGSVSSECAEHAKCPVLVVH